jgi:opacity protein-like surface antigen
LDIPSGSLANLEGGNGMTKGLFKGIGALGVIAALGATSAHAQAAGNEGGNRITVGAFGGIAIPLSDYNNVVKTGWDLGAAFQFKPAKSPVGFQIDGAYLQNKFDESVTLTSGKAEWWFGTGDIVFWFPVAAETRVRPYILGGGGVYNYKIKPSGTSSSTSETKFGINVGAGFDFDVGQNAGVFIEGRFHNVFFSSSDPITSVNLKFIPINVGLRYHFR